MDLTNKSNVDFRDAHLWAESVKFHVSCSINRLMYFFPLIWAHKMLVHPHGDKSEDLDYYVHVEFTPDWMNPPDTSNNILRLLRVAIDQCGSIEMESEGHIATLDAEGNILGLRELDRI